MTGCDTTSYLHGVGKIKVFKKYVNSKEKMNLLQDIGVPSTITEKTVDKVLKFFQTMCYPGMEDESVTETRVRIYKQLKTKIYLQTKTLCCKQSSEFTINYITGCHQILL